MLVRLATVLLQLAPKEVDVVSGSRQWIFGALAALLMVASPVAGQAAPSKAKRPKPAPARATDTTPAPSRDVSALTARGRALIRAGKLREADGVLREASRASGGSIESLYELARVQFAADDYAKSRSACRAVTAKDRNALLSDLCLARAFMVWRRASRAEEYIASARAKAPQDPEVLLAVGDYHRLAGELDASRAAYERLTTIAPGHAEAHYGLGELYLIKPDPDAARREFAAAHRSAPDWAEAAYQLGRLERGARAVELLESALATRPGWTEARVELGAAKLELGQVDAAEALFRQVLQVAPTLPVAHARLGMALAAKRDYRNAELELKRGLEGLPNDADAALWLARVYAQTDRAEDAFAAYRDASSREKVGSRALLEAGVFAMKLGRNTLAQAFLEKAVERSPKSAAAQARLADVHLTRGDKALAKQHYQLALSGEGEVDRQDLKRRLDALK